jgi:hypothetical protein
MFTLNTVISIGIACLFAGAFIGFAAFAIVSVNKTTEQQYEAQTEEALLGTPRPSFDKRA